MKLYKYVNPSGIEILATGLIRFTQPSLFNDPFEMSPYIQAIASEHQIEEKFDNEHEYQVRVLYEKHNRAFKRRISYEVYKTSFSKEILLPRIQANAKGEALTHVRESLPIAINQALGVLCLTTKFDNLLMWAHYAQSHEGMVIEFEADSSFFNQALSEHIPLTGLDEDLSREYGRLIKVKYKNERPQINISEVNSFDSFLVKSKEWEYEEEYRMIMPTTKANKVIQDKNGLNVYLYELPREIITKVILGYRSSPELLNQIYEIKAKENIVVERMSLDEKDFKLISKSI